MEKHKKFVNLVITDVDLHFSPKTFRFCITIMKWYTISITCLLRSICFIVKMYLVPENWNQAGIELCFTPFCINALDLPVPLFIFLK